MNKSPENLGTIPGQLCFVNLLFVVVLLRSATNVASGQDFPRSYRAMIRARNLTSGQIRSDP